MNPVHIVMGGLGFFAMLAMLIGAMRGAERLTSRLLRLPAFRWFEEGDRAGAWWRRLLVRTASVAAPFLVSASLFCIVYSVGGAPEVTTTVTVLEGAARDAGVCDGDKVLAVGGVPVQTWDEFRSRITSQVGPTELGLERAGERLKLSVTPRAGRIGVAPIPKMRPIGFVAAASRGVQLPLRMVADSVKQALAVHESELKGPVGIVKETRQAHKGWLELLFFLGMLGAYFWPVVAVLHVVDAVRGWAFRKTSVGRL